MIQETPLSLAQTLTLHSSIRQLVRDEDKREFELDLCSCLLLVKIVGAACLLGPCPAASHCPALYISDSNWEENHYLGVSDGGGGKTNSTPPELPWGL